MYEKEQQITENQDVDTTKCQMEQPEILDDILIEELAIDGICGVY